VKHCFRISRLVSAVHAAGPWLVLLAIGLIACGCGPSLSAPELYRRATYAARDADMEGALRLVEQCLELEPNRVEALILQGYCHYSLMTPEQLRDDASSAERPLEQAVGLESTNFMAQYMYGWILFEAGKYSMALEPLERAYESRDKEHPENEDSLLVMLSTCCVQQNLVRGRSYLQTLRRFGGFENSALLYNALGVLNVKQMDYKTALSNFMEALQRDEDHPVVLLNLAILHDEYLKRPEDAMRYYARAIAARQAMRDASRQDAIRNRLKQLVVDRRRPRSM